MNNSILGLSLRNWRKKQRMTQDQLAKSVASSQSMIQRWETGDAKISDSHMNALRALGWAPPSNTEEPSKAAAAIAKMRELLDAGRPRTEIYEEAQRVLASLLDQGLTLDEKRAWDALFDALADGMKEEGRLVPLHKHPEWHRCIEIILRAILPWPDALRAVQEEMRRLG